MHLKIKSIETIKKRNNKEKAKNTLEDVLVCVCERTVRERQENLTTETRHRWGWVGGETDNDQK